MVDNIHQKRIWRPWNQCGSICLHLRRHIWNSRVHERSVTSSGHEGTPAWTKAKPSLSRRSHRKTYRPPEARIYHSCVEQDSVHLKFNSACKHTAWSTSLSPRVADDAGLGQFDCTRPVSRKKNTLARTFSWPGVEATAILAATITWWHGNIDCGCSRFKLLNCFSWAEYWLLWKKWWHHVIIGIKHDCVCRAAPSWSLGAARQLPREFDTNNTHTIMFDPLTKDSSIHDNYLTFPRRILPTRCLKFINNGLSQWENTFHMQHLISLANIVPTWHKIIDGNVFIFLSANAYTYGAVISNSIPGNQSQTHINQSQISLATSVVVNYYTAMIHCARALLGTIVWQL